MPKTKIGVVEDEIIIADSIRSVLKSMRYVVPEPCCDYHEAMAMLHVERPDLVLLDINLAGNELDGVAIARYIRDHMDMPFIFLTANSDPGTLERAKTVMPDAFLVKPFQGENLYTAIEIAIHNFYSKRARQHIFIKEGTLFQKVPIDDILYLESEHVYVNVYTTSRKYLVRTSLQQYVEELDKDVFVRIHRGYVVNRHKIDCAGEGYVHVGGRELPISQKYRSILKDMLRT